MNKKIFSILILFATLFMSIGYATINSISLDINGVLMVSAQEGIFITSVNYKSSENADPSYSTINSTAQTVLDSSIVLSDDSLDGASSITYSITVYNSSSFDYQYVETAYDSLLYDNGNIIFSISIKEGEIVPCTGDKTLTFDITFKYADGVIPSNSLNVLNSTLNFKFELVPIVVGEYDYSGNIEILSLPYTGTYKLEVWGAQGGTAYSDTYRGGYGGYSTGDISLSSGERLFIAVGGQGESGSIDIDKNGGYNGGGSIAASTDSPTNRYVGAGGGATHIAKTTGLLVSLSNDIDSILIVAGGGGGGYKHTSTGYYGGGGDAGGFEGESGTYGSKGGGFYGTGGTQTEPGYAYGKPTIGVGAFGLGGSLTTQSHGSAGGSGFYGGGASYGTVLIDDNGNSNSSGGGGSSYIGNSLLTNKYMVCYQCNTSSDVATKTNSVSNVSSTATVDYAKSGNGYARITFISE